jgi:hypothetical protein
MSTTQEKFGYTGNNFELPKFKKPLVLSLLKNSSARMVRGSTMLTMIGEPFILSLAKGHHERV